MDDERALCEAIQDLLAKRGFEVVWRTSPQDALDLLRAEEFDVVLSDVRMGRMDGIELCTRIAESWPKLPTIVMTAFGSIDVAVAALRAGAYDFLQKPIEHEPLVVALERAIERRRLVDEVRKLREVIQENTHLGKLIGSSDAMARVYGVLGRIADSPATVLITGESGTGKEVAARALHERSPRRDRPFVAINCSAVPESLLESELFGHARGAFTDARAARAGLMLQANGGTLLLDEIGDMPLSLQPKLLRALQERTLRPVGGDDEVPFDVRIIATTNRDLHALVEEERFREDLYFRINVIHVEMPPLRARGGDVLLLAQHFVDIHAARAGKRVTGLDPGAAKKLIAYGWPGNVRELQNCIERAIALTQHEKIGVEDLPDTVREYRRSPVLVAGDDPSELVPLSEVERRYILKVVETVGGNKTTAAHILGVTRKTLYRKLEEYGTEEGADAG